MIRFDPMMTFTYDDFAYDAFLNKQLIELELYLTPSLCIRANKMIY